VSSGLVPLLLAQGIFTKSMNEIIDLMNQVLPRLRAVPRRTSFERARGDGLRESPNARRIRRLEAVAAAQSRPPAVGLSCR